MKMTFGGIQRVIVGILCLAGFAGGTGSSALADHTKPVPYGDVYRMDTGFAIALENRGEINAVVASPDGGYYVGGIFTMIGGQKRNHLAKFRADGTVDTAFEIGLGFDGAVSAIALQPDGRIVVGGSFNHFKGAALKGIARLNTDGSLDKSFHPGAGFNGKVGSVAVQTDGRIVAGGQFTQFDGVACNYIVQLNADGSRDTTFSSGSGFNHEVYVVAVQRDGRIVAGGWFWEYNGVTQESIARLNADGTLDAGFDTGGALRIGVMALAIQPDGKIVAGGGFMSYYDDGSFRWGLTRLNANGTLDKTFAPELGYTAVYSVAIQSDGRVVIGGYVSPKYPYTFSGTVLRFNPDGSLDTTLNSGAASDLKFDLGVNSVAVLGDGKIVAGGIFTWFDGALASGLALLTATGAADVLITDCRWPGEAQIVPVAGGKFIVGGDFDFVNDVEGFSLARVNADGSTDRTFNSYPGFGAPVDFVKVAFDGRVVVGVQGSFYWMNEDGSHDWTFSPASETPAVKVFLPLPDGRMLVAGQQWRWTADPPASVIVRLNADGSLDPTYSFGSKFMFGDMSGTIESVVLQADGRILVGGHFDRYNGAACGGIVRLNTDGTLDPTFDPGTGVGGTAAGNSPEVSCVVVQADGRIVASGLFEQFNGVARKGIVRLHPDGSVDPTFHAGVDLHEFFTTLTIQDDGRMIVSGNSAGVVRLNPNGSLDRRFALPDLTWRGASETSFMTDGRLLLSSSGASRDGLSQIGVALLKPEKLRSDEHHDHRRPEPPKPAHQKGPAPKERPAL